MIFVLGPTGKVGAELIRSLQARGADVRALAHSSASAAALRAQNVDVVQGDFAQLTAQHFNGVDKLFLLTPSSPRQVEDEQALIDAARQAGVRHIVKLSAYDVGRDTAVGRIHGAIESHLKASGVPYTILQPNNFMQNFPVINAPTIAGQGAIFVPTSQGHISFVDTRDIAEVAAIALTQPGHDNQTYELTGPEALTYADAAALFSKHLGRPVQHVDISSDDYKQGLLGAGVPEWYAGILQELFARYRDGHGARVSDAVQRVTGRPARTLDAYIAENTQRFQAVAA